jgi:hemerythrin-like domain-containing protein
MEHKAISQQLLIEYELLSHLESALRTILQWTSHRQDLPRKLSSLRFMTQSFERHLERLMTLEEHDGYMEVVTESRPSLSPQVDALRAEHDVLRRALRRVGLQLERLTPDDSAPIDQVSAELVSLLERVDEHSQREVDLLQESLLQEEGGAD